MEHHHHRHQHPAEKAREVRDNTENHLADKTLHAHNHAMPHGGHQPPAHGEHGHDHHAMMINDFRKRFWISLLLSLPVIIISPMVQGIVGYRLDIPYNMYIAFVLSTIIFFYGGWPFLTGLKDELKKGAPGMMTLIAIAITVAYLYSSAVVFGLPGMDFFWELATLIVIMLLGHWIEMKSVSGASRALELLVSLMPSEAHVIKGDETVNIRIDNLKKNDLILVRSGEKVPADA